MNSTEKRVLEYIKNTGGNPTVEWFDEDFEPIGKSLREEMIGKHLIIEKGGKLYDQNQS